MEELEIELEDRIVTIPAGMLRRVQAAWRGALVRKHLASLRKNYEQVVRETELPGFSLHLTWPADRTAAPRFSRSDRQGLTITTTERPVPKHEPTKTSHPGTQQQVDSRPDPTETYSSTGIQCDKEIPVPIEPEVKEVDKGVGGSKPEGGSEGQRTEEGIMTKDGSDRLLGLEVEEDGTQRDTQGFTLTQHTTGVWDSVDVSRFPGSTQQQPEQLDRESLLNERNTIAMELMWIQQAIESRKQYLRLRDEMSGSAT